MQKQQKGNRYILAEAEKAIELMLPSRKWKEKEHLDCEACSFLLACFKQKNNVQRVLVLLEHVSLLSCFCLTAPW